MKTEKKSKVAVIPCEGYQEDAVYLAISRGLELLGGLEAFLSPEEKILLKPNLLNRAEADQAVTTHPAVFSAVTRCLQESGYGKLFYGDSPGHPGSLEKTAEICGIKAVADRFQIPFGEFSKGRTVSFAQNNRTRKFEISEGALDADAIINLCKMKTHQLERITGAVKNLFGCVYGFHKGASHAKYPDADSFAQMLVDLNLLLKARLHIMDGIVAMEGNGPASGTPVKMRVILLSADPVALDATFCRLIDLDPQFVPTIYYGHAFGLGVWREEDIEILGTACLPDLANPDFEVSRERAMVGKWSAMNKLRAFARKPVILESRCIGCGACVNACPLEDKAIKFPDILDQKRETKQRKRIPVYQYKKCIKCYCCQEMCPEKAILVKRKLF